MRSLNLEGHDLSRRPSRGGQATGAEETGSARSATARESGAATVTGIESVTVTANGTRIAPTAPRTALTATEAAIVIATGSETAIGHEKTAIAAVATRTGPTTSTTKVTSATSNMAQNHHKP
jgi:hypothetical protein